MVAAVTPVDGIAQTRADERPLRRLEVSGGGGLSGGAALPGGDANLRARGGGDFTLFTTESELARAPMIEARVGYALSRRYGVEAHVGFSRPDLRTMVAGDVEGAPSLTASERVDQYLIDGAFVVMLDGLRIGGLVPFGSAGAGYLRQLHEGQTLVEHGIAYHAGGGVKQWFAVRPGRLLKAIGLRGDVRLYLVSGGVAGDGGVRPHPAVSGSVFVTF